MNNVIRRGVRCLLIQSMNKKIIEKMYNELKLKYKYKYVYINMHKVQL